MSPSLLTLYWRGTNDAGLWCDDISVFDTAISVFDTATAVAAAEDTTAAEDNTAAVSDTHAEVRFLVETRDLERLDSALRRPGRGVHRKRERGRRRARRPGADVDVDGRGRGGTTRRAPPDRRLADGLCRERGEPGTSWCGCAARTRTRWRRAWSARRRAESAGLAQSTPRFCTGVDEIISISSTSVTLEHLYAEVFWSKTVLLLKCNYKNVLRLG